MYPKIKNLFLYKKNIEFFNLFYIYAKILKINLFFNWFNHIIKKFDIYIKNDFINFIFK